MLIVSLGVGILLLATPGPAQSQVNREAIRSLGLSRSQMQEMRGVMQGYQSELEDILTSEQQQQLDDLQEEMQGSSATGNRPDLFSELNLSDDQASQLEILQVDMAADLGEILSDEQLERAQELGFPGL
ncbi:MAG: hypothetical protein AAFY26_07230 [Cyanobacteria bacterium J06638_22]